MKQLGAKNVFHLPVAANIKRINKSICKNGFISDVSFVGNLTKSKYRQLLMPRLSDKSLFFIDNLIHKQNNQIDDFILKKYLTTDFVLKILKESNVDIENYLFPHLSLKEQMAFYLGHEQSYIERINFAKAFEKNFDDFKVYGNDEWINNIECYNGKAEHFQKMPEVFNRSKINLNLTRTFVESGLPMRVFDIIGSCGFLLSNYKEELTECFEDKKDIAIFHSLEEAIELSKYYLKNDDLRFKMIENAYSKLEKLHTFKNRIEYILKEVLN